MSGIAKKDLKQAGMVSILVTMLLMIIISLIVLGFAQISRRNQRQALDRQLSTQAFYAAETGVNDARNLIKQAIAAGTAVPAKSDCTDGAGPTAAFYGPLNEVLDAAKNVAYTCLIVNPTPTKLLYGDVGMGSIVVPLIASAGNITKVNLTWQSKATTTTPIAGCPATTTGVFAQTTSWACGYGVIRIDLVSTAGSLSASGLQNGTMTSFLVPQASGSPSSTNTTTFSASPSFSSSRIGVNCSNTNCNLAINVPASSQYYMRISSIYKNVSLQIGTTDASNAALAMQGAQAQIDATGKAQDVLRRIQVSVPLTASSSNQMSDYALETTDSVCKRFAVMDGYFQSFSRSVVSGLTSITTPPNPLCQ